VARFFLANADFQHALQAKKRTAASSAVTDKLARQREKCLRCQREKSLARDFFCRHKTAYAWDHACAKHLALSVAEEVKIEEELSSEWLRKPSTPGREIWIWRQRRVATAKHANRQKRPRATGATKWRGKRESGSDRKPVDVRTAGNTTNPRVACALSTRKHIGRCAWLWVPESRISPCLRH